ncbi:membrane protein [Rhizobium leguminosarum bv. trifolii CB782]|nr:membrane protein [Rhizobium leguminosarum bv. trifolii CB782]
MRSASPLENKAQAIAMSIGNNGVSIEQN